MPEPTSPPGDPPGGGGGGTDKPKGTTVYDPPALPQGRAGLRTLVRRHDGTPLPNLRLLSIEHHEFMPPSAQFRYSFDQSSNASMADPTRVEHCFSLAAKGKRIASLDDRIQVVRQVGKDKASFLFDGFVVAPQANLAPRNEMVTLTVAGTPIREWDTPLAGAIWRDSDGLITAPEEDAAPHEPQDIHTDLPTRFNPDGKGNKTPLGGDSVWYAGETFERKFPVFADPSLSPLFGTDPRLPKWTLVDACKYVMGVGHKGTYIRIGDLKRLETILKSAKPKEEGGFIDFADPESFDLEDIVVPDIDVTGMPWPAALRSLVEPHGFGFRFVLSTSVLDDPVWTIEFYRKDDSTKAKRGFLQKPPQPLIPGKSIVSGMTLARDCSGIQNVWKAATGLVEHEAAFILDLQQDPSAADLVTDSNPASDRSGVFVKDVRPDVSTATFDPIAYRVWVADEAGEGRWDRITGERVVEAASMQLALQPSDAAGNIGQTIGGIFGGGGLFVAPPSEGTEKRTWVRRRRPPIAKLATLDSTGEREGWDLYLGVNYGGKAGVWDRNAANLDGTGKGGTWVKVTKGGARLLDDRLGVELTLSDPRNWTFGNPGGPVEALKSGLVNVPAAMASGTLPSAGTPNPDPARLCMMLVCCIEGDHDIDAEAKRRAASPTKFEITRYEDCRDRYEKRLVTKASYNLPDGKAAKVILDDTKDATSQVEARRRANESGTFAGSLHVPFFTDSLQIGDKIKGIVGRDIDFAMNAAREQGESATYPVVVGLSWDFDGQQATTVTLQDYRAEPPPEVRRMRHA